MEKIKYIKSYVEDVKDSEKGTMIVGAVASTESEDRDGDKVKLTGWDLKNFKKAPRLLWSHDASALPIGKVTNIGTKDNKLKFDAIFAEKENKFAQDVSKMFKSGFLNTFSVGFIPQERDDDGNITKQELLEISAVNIPSNPEAMTQHSYKDFVDKVIKQASTSTQTLILSKKVFKTVEEAKKWVTEHDFKVHKVDDTENSYRFRQFDPSECTEESLRTITLTDGVKSVICRRSDDKKVKEDKEDEKLLILNQIASLKETTLALEKHLLEIKKNVSKGEDEKPSKKPEPKKNSPELSALRLIDRQVEYLIRREKKKGGAKNE